MKKTAVIAIGGNAILQADEEGSAEEQFKNIKVTCEHLVKILKEGYNVVITHGNGPQVGNIMLRNEFSQDVVSPMPMDVCVAESQGQIGYMIQQTLINILKKHGIDKTVISLVTQVVVDEKDPAFKNPTKPVGPFYTMREAKKLKKSKIWEFIEDKARGGYRRVVPSPKPLEIVERHAIKRFIDDVESGGIIIAAGGGGIPVIKTERGYEGIDAVIDKDLASSVLAANIGADNLIMLTDVDKVALNFSKPDQKDIDNMTVEKAERYLDEGHFPAGSMGPKIEAAIRFLKQGGKGVLITTPINLERGLKGEEGTYILLN